MSKTLPVDLLVIRETVYAGDRISMHDHCSCRFAGGRICNLPRVVGLAPFVLRSRCVLVVIIAKHDDVAMGTQAVACR